MEKEPKSVIYSTQFKQDIIDVYKYGVDTFGKAQAEKYQNIIYKLVDDLNVSYDIYPECRHLQEKSRIYRWIILDSHLIIYRITAKEIQVLRILHFKNSIRLLTSGLIPVFTYDPDTAFATNNDSKRL